MPRRVYKEADSRWRSVNIGPRGGEEGARRGKEGGPEGVLVGQIENLFKRGSIRQLGFFDQKKIGGKQKRNPKAKKPKTQGVRASHYNVLWKLFHLMGGWANAMRERKKKKSGR